MKYDDWLKEWLALYVKPTSKFTTWLKYERLRQNYISPRLGECEVGELSASRLQTFTAELYKTLAPSTVNCVITVIHGSLKAAALCEVVQKDCSVCIVRPKCKQKESRCFNKRQQQKIERRLLANPDAHTFGIVLCLYTGLRIGELLALRWQDINIAKGTLQVNHTCRDSWVGGRYVKILDTPKTESSVRTIPIPKQLLPYIRELKKKAKSDFFVESRTEQGAQVRSYQKTFARILKNLNIPALNFHALRHTFATRALECGMDVKTLSEILGHKNPTVTLNRYAHSFMQHKTEMQNRLGRLLSD